MVRYLFYTIGDLTYQSPLVQSAINMEVKCIDIWILYHGRIEYT